MLWILYDDQQIGEIKCDCNSTGKFQSRRIIGAGLIMFFFAIIIDSFLTARCARR
jgi:hypothetical protein